MSCCDPRPGSPLETLPAGLSSLPRQLRGFPEVRRDLLRALGADPGALAGWQPSGDDFGLMWLEMWAYVSDVLGFYDERAANESYIRTAVRRSSLRRIVELLGYTPTSGIAATATVAALADGAIAVTLPPATGFRSSAFAGEPPQIFETTAEWTIHPLKNQWKVVSFKRRPTVDAAPDVTDTGATTNQKKASPSGGPNVRHLLFETAGFGLAADELVLFESRKPGVASPVTPPVTLVTAAAPFEGKDSLTYIRVTLEPAVTIPVDTDLSTLRARRPTQTATPTIHEPVIDVKTTAPPVENVSGGTRAFFDQLPGAFRRSDPILVARNFGSAEAEYAFATISSVRVGAVKVTSIPEQTVTIPQPDSNPDLVVTIPSPTVAATELTLQPALPASFVDNPEELTFLFDFVDGGQPTNSGKTEVSAAELASLEGIPLDGIVAPPPDAVATAADQGLSQTSNVTGVLEQQFLLSDAAKTGVAADGRITFTSDGRASFQALAVEQLPASPLQLPLTIYGNLVETTRGESVFGEVLGNGDARIANQRFKLRKKPLTYLPLSTGGGSAMPVSTLQIWVDGVQWNQVVTFFGAGSEDSVYTVRHDDEQNTFVTFGDGVRGARLPSGVKNVVANYRFGAGAAAPPAGTITQLAGSVKGLRSVRSPVAAGPGKDPDQPEQLRTNAPRTTLLFGRLVSAVDFETLARQQAGIVQAKAEWLWIPAQMQAGIVVVYIGEADAVTIRDTLSAQADPTIPIEVTQAQRIPATLSIGVEVEQGHVKETVAAAVLAHLTAHGTGVLSLEQARIGGTFWPSVLYEAVSQVDGVVAVSGASFSTGSGGPLISNSSGTCIETGKYLDFSAPGSVTVTGVDPIGSAPAGSET
jgi:predicted phage baseplate assembly protein